jgi:hypothetical protein
MYCNIVGSSFNILAIYCNILDIGHKSLNQLVYMYSMMLVRKFKFRIVQETIK